MQAANTAPSTGTISGTLTAHDGTAIQGARVTAHLNTAANISGLSAGPAITGLLQASATTAADGSFVLGKLAAGTYTICAQAAQSAELDPCHWGQTPPQVTLTAGQTVAGVKLSTKKGSILNVRIDDPKHLLLGPATVLGLPHVLVGVYTLGGQFYPAFVNKKDITGLSYSITIPVNTALRLTVASKHVKLADSIGNLVPANGLTYAFRHDSSVDNSKPVLFQITG